MINVKIMNASAWKILMSLMIFSL